MKSSGSKSPAVAPPTAKKDGQIRALATKLEALDRAVTEIQADIDDEATLKAEAEEKLRQVNKEMAALNPGDQDDIRKARLRRAIKASRRCRRRWGP